MRWGRETTKILFCCSGNEAWLMFGRVILRGDYLRRRNSLLFFGELVVEQSSPANRRRTKHVCDGVVRPFTYAPLLD